MPNHPFIDYLAGLAARADRGALAHLRRGLGKPPGTAPEMFPLVVPWIPSDASPGVQEAYFLVAALFAAHPDHSGAIGGLGDTFHHMSDEQNRAGLERRFVALLNTHAEDLPDRLRQIISLARSKGAPVNYDRLLEDLRHWNRPDRRVQRQWAREFWGAHAAPDPAAASTPTQTQSQEPEEN